MSKIMETALNMTFSIDKKALRCYYNRVNNFISATG